jgi:hypothetical protein
MRYYIEKSKKGMQFIIEKGEMLTKLITSGVETAP